jgi:hypothetical protein
MRKQPELSSDRRRLGLLKRLGCFLLAISTFLWSRPAQAVTVALLRPSSQAAALGEALSRLQGELIALGVSVTIIDEPGVRDAKPEEQRASLERTARERGIDAFIAVVGDEVPEAADVWILHRSPPVLSRSRVVVDPTAENRVATLAIRAIEVLRSNFVALDFPAREPAPTIVSRSPAAPKTRAPRDEPKAWLGLEAGAGALTTLDKLGPAFMPVLRVDAALGARLSVQASAAGLGTRPRVETAAGHVDVARELGLVGLCLCTQVRRNVQPLFALAAGALHTRLDAQAVAPNLGRRVQRWAALFDASVGLRLGLPGRTYVTLAGHVELAEPYVAIHVLDSIVATSGRPNLLLTLTAGARP